MQLNYVGSVAERFMRFRSTLASTEESTTNLFNAISIYVPKSLASANLSAESYNPDEVTADKYAVLTVTADNYTSVLSTGSVLASQWSPIFNDGTNLSVILYILVFDDTDFEVSVTAGAVTWEPLTKVFNDLYYISYFKVMFSEHYDGSVSTAETGAYDDSNFFDMALALSYLCENEDTLSMCLCEVQVTVFDKGAEDTNNCKVMSLERGDETNHCTTFVGSTKDDRMQYFWGYINLMGGSHTWFIIHNGLYMFPVVLGRWFEALNASGEFVGNKLQKIRLNASGVKPTGLPSPLNSDVNLNLDSSIYEILDAKYVGYFISIADGTDNNAELTSDRAVSNYPVTAHMICKYIDYNASQDCAKYRDAVTTLTNPVLANQEAYAYIQSILVGRIQQFSGTNRVTNIQTNFPDFAVAKVGNSFEGVAVWSAVYIDDLGGVEMTGSMSF